MRAVSSSVFLLVLTAGAAGSPLSAQRRELALLGGGNLSSVSGERVSKAQARTGFQAGISIRMPRSTMLYFQTELLLIKRRFYAERAASTQPPLAVGPRSDAPDLLYAQVPILMRLQKGYSTQRPVRPYLVLGPYLSIRLACKRELVEASGGLSHPDCSISPPPDRPTTTDPFLPALYQDLDVGVLGEVGVEVKRFALGVRGEKGLRNLVDPGTVATSPLQGAKTWSASLTLEYLLRVL